MDAMPQRLIANDEDLIINPERRLSCVLQSACFRSDVTQRNTASLDVITFTPTHLPMKPCLLSEVERARRFNDDWTDDGHA